MRRLVVLESGLESILLDSGVKIWLLFLILCAHVKEVQKNWRDTASPFGGNVADHLESRCSPTSVIVSNFIVLGQNVWA